VAIDVDTLERGLGATGRIVQNVRPEQLGDKTPCTEWAVRDLLNHIVGTTLMFGSCAAGGSSEWNPFAFPGDVIAEDVSRQYDAAAADAVSAWRHRGTEGLLTLPVGDLPALVALRIEFCDVLVHGWDLAQATGQHHGFDDDLIEEAWGHLEDNLSDDSRGDGRPFAPIVSVPDDAATLDRMLGYMGRTP
jgi:uncharacterized protein (TIGR03086 family)